MNWRTVLGTLGLTFIFTACAACADAVNAGPPDRRGERGLETSYDFDANDRLIAVHVPDGTVVKYEYGGSDAYELARQGNSGGDGRVVAVGVFRRNERGGLEPMPTPEGPSRFQYDRNRDCIQASNNLGKTEYFYDPRRQLTKVTYDYPQLKASISHEYDVDGRISRTAVTSPADALEFHVDYNYDMIGRITEKDLNGLRIKYAYDPSGTKLTRELPNGVRTVYETAPGLAMQQVETFAGNDRLGSFRYQYGPDRQLERQIDDVAGKSRETRFEYNPLGQLTGVERSDSGRIAVNYDATGSLRELRIPTGLVDVERNPLGFIDRVGDTRFTRDAAGRPTAYEIGSQSHRLAYDGFGRLQDWSSPAGVWTYDYSAEGFRLDARLAEQKWTTVPDPLSLTDNPLFVSGPDFLGVKADRDLSVQFVRERPQVTFEDPSGYPFARGTIAGNRWDFQSPEILRPDVSGVPLESPWKRPFTFAIPQIPRQQPDLVARQFQTELRLHVSDLGRNVLGETAFDGLTRLHPADRMPVVAPDIFTGRAQSELTAKLILGDVRTPDQFMDQLIRVERSWFSFGTALSEYVGSPKSGIDMLKGFKGGLGFGQDILEYTSDTRGLGVRLWDNIALGRGSEGLVEHLATKRLPKGSLGGVALGEGIGLAYDLARGHSITSPEGLEHILDLIAYGAVMRATGGNAIVAKLATESAGLVRELTRPTFEEAGRVLGRTGHDVAASWIWAAGRAAETGTLDQFKSGLGSRSLEDTVRIWAPWLHGSFREFDQAVANNDYAKMAEMFRHDANIRSHLRGQGYSTADIETVASRLDSRAQGNPVAGPGSSRSLMGESLANLGQKDFLPKGVKFDKPAEFHGQIGAIRGVYWDKQTKRLALVGDGNMRLPPVRLDDFAAAVRVVYEEHPGEPHDPTFSLDPADPSNPDGEWLVAVYRPALLEGSHLGDVMLRADWLLKEYALGVVADYSGRIHDKRISSVPGYASYLELLLANRAALDGGSLTSRLWIVPDEMKLENAGGMIVFARATMRVETHRMEVVDGALHDSPDKSDPIADKFAAFFTAHYDEFAREAPVLEELREAAKVVAIVQWLKKQGVNREDFVLPAAPTRPDATATAVPASPFRIHSLSVSAGAAWGLGGGAVRLVGGVRLAPRPIPTPASTAAALQTRLATALAQPTTASAGVLVDRLGNATTTSVFTVLPISGPSREFLQQRPLYTIDGVTYALDEQRRLRHAFDSLGDSVTYEYDAQNRLTEVHYRDAADWQLHGTMSDGGERQLRCDTPNGDRLLYRFAADGALSEALVNEIPVARATWNADRSAVTLQHVRIVEDEEIGRLTVTKTEKVVATERLTRQPDGKIIYQREGNSREPQTVTLTRSPQGVTLEVPGLGTLGLKKAGEFAFIAEGPSGQVRWDFDPQSGRLTKISRDNGDYVELLSGTELADGSTMLLESKRGAAVAQVSASADRVVVRDFLGRRTVYGYAHGRLASIDSPLGKTSYEYTEDGGRLAAIRFPDHSVQRFQWREGTGVTRLTTWREAAVP